MSKLNRLRIASSKPDFAKVLEVDSSFLTRVLYINKPESQYHKFTIAKKSGGLREISAPSIELKSLQKSLSKLLLDCIDEINAKKYPYSQLNKPKLRKNGENDYAAEVLKIKIPTSSIKQPSISHGFVRDRSIITNAMMHLGKKNVLNIDLEDFFGSFNFGRVRGFFIKNKNFRLDPHIATIIAQIACYDNKLPQGSPSSPVITNLITHSLDMRLASLAKKFKCTYTRYADDITFSTRLIEFPAQIMKQNEDGYIAGKILRREIKHAGFSINESKTRIQYKNSRQDVTGLIVNKKPNTKKEYWRLVRAKCNHLFKTGYFVSIVDGKEIKGNINELEGQLNFIDQVDHYNRMRQRAPLNPEYARSSVGKHTRNLLTGREKTFRNFLFYRLFCGNDKPTILCEGKTDNIYLKSAISELVKEYPQLARKKASEYELLVRFVEYSKRTRFLLELYGGTDYLRNFIDSFEANMKVYSNIKPKNPVILFVDNDKGTSNIKNLLSSKSFIKKIKISPSSIDKNEQIRKSQFIHVVKNLYVVFTPLASNDDFTDVEYFFDDKARLMKHSNGKCFNTVRNRNDNKDLSKDAFATHIVKENKKNIDFTGFKPLLNSIVEVINHYESIKKA
ncbi:retron Ec67 family RNA-directed DNA polymerase/endonuclease [Photobacterium angustum]|uniref:RNA-directed DNA polymerase n=2 Tax=Photobacterium angustum TaxID=661 RepID=A0A855SIL9_PHOAN|nr:retron Ec67 family RNA-directed DNA polymerase/endonuclease [Photobacterium angustum]KJG42738.1 ribonuclease H [Photobacterium angustum]PSX08905.1 RNA-directed DNA polymerase [Photobacterium angustum]PSX14656.1 RNA-directed DNA polymerase [Photobacterium angustum]PSX22706.1 RNA-directed DNA polymerase [Photobacterium angustum]PSX41815.1 RNA-directed DNA polymerase [Photobacterium angustum]